MVKKMFAVSLAALLVACSGNPDGKIVKTQVDTLDMVCETMASTGSHLKKRSCMSQGMADALREQNRDALRKQQSKGQTSAGTK